MKSFLLALVITLASLSSYAQSNEVIICNGKYSERYHSRVCSGLNNCRGGLEKVTLKKAKELRRTPCITCYGATVSPDRSNEPSYTPPSPGSNQCRATTKKGT